MAQTVGGTLSYCSIASLVLAAVQLGTVIVIIAWLRRQAAARAQRAAQEARAREAAASEKASREKLEAKKERREARRAAAGQGPYALTE